MSSREQKDVINLLSLDGGGVRGVASLLILHEIMVKIQETQGLDKVPKPCDYFHMIGGTSTGGLIAIMLGRLRMSTEEALLEYDHCAKQIFAFENKKWSTATEKFRATALQDAVQALVHRRNMGENLLEHPILHNAKGQCFVCAMPAKAVGEPWRLRSFYSEHCRFDSHLKIWEAARATTAATSFFKPAPLPLMTGGTEDFIDAAIGCNNPVEYLIKEAADSIGSSKRLGCLVSIGTGTRAIQIERAPTGLKNILHLPKFFKEAVGALKNTATDGEETHRRVHAKLGRHSNAYFRFNIPEVADKVRLHEYRKMDILKATTTAHLDDSSVAAQVLAAATTLARNSPEHGLSLGHIDGVDKDQIIPMDHEALPIGDISRFFLGRDDILARLDACFPVRDTGGKPRREFLLYGMGGVGKTQTALQAADHLEDRFKYVFTIDGTDALTTAKGYAKICQDHCQQGSLGQGTTEGMKSAALKWMGKLTDEWLLIYDNIPNNARLQPLLPDRLSGNIIYTSRSQGFLSTLPADCACEVKPLSEPDAVDLLLRISGRENFGSDEKETASARELVARVGNLPLAIESAGTYIRQGQISVSKYLQTFRDQTQRSALLSNPESDSSLAARPSLYTALDLSYVAISTIRRREGRSVPGRAARFALNLLNLLCFYHCEAIPAMMIMRAATERQQADRRHLTAFADPNDPDTDASELLYFDTDDKWHSLPFRLGVRMLQQFSLVKYSKANDDVSMHVMVQEWALDRIKAEHRPRQALMARVVLAESLKPGLKLQDHLYSRSIAPHIHACQAHEATTGLLARTYQAQLDFKLGWFYNEENKFSPAAEHFASVASIWEAVAGPNDRVTTCCLGLLANAYRDLGRWRDAEKTYRDVIARLHRRADEAVAAHGGLARRETERQGREAISRELARLFSMGNRMVNKVTGKKEGEDPAGKSQGTGSSSSVDTTRATPKLTAEACEDPMRDIQSGELDKTKQDDDDDDGDAETTWDWYSELAMIGANLGLVLLDQGRFGAAKKCLTQAITILKEEGYPNDLRVWLWEDELKLHFEPGDLQHWNKRVDARRALPGDMVDEVTVHQCRILTAIGFATAMLERGRPKDGYEVYKNAFENTTIFYGATDRRTLMMMRNMAKCQLELGLFEEAEELARTTLELARACYGQHHLQTAQCLLLLSSAIRCQTLDLGPGSEYWGILQDAYDSARLAFSDEHYLAVQIKTSMDRRLGLRPTKEEISEEAEAISNEYMELLKQAVDKAGPMSKQEFEILSDVLYREWLRDGNQAHLRVQTPRARSTISQEVEVGSNGGSAKEQEALGKASTGETPPGETPSGETLPGETPSGDTLPGETPSGKTLPGETPSGKTPPVKTSHRTKKQKKKQRAAREASTKLSPILEDDTGEMEVDGMRDPELALDSDLPAS